MGNKKNLFVIIPVLVALSLKYVPHFWVYTAILIDFYTPWVLFDSPMFAQYHEFLVSGLPDREEIPLLEINYTEATKENVRRLTNDYTVPIVIRGLLQNTTAVKYWKDPDWWIENYGDEEALCGTQQAVIENCTFTSFFEAVKNGNPFYIAGAASVFDRRPELQEMLENDAIKAMEPDVRTASQVFIGLPDMGTDVHSAMGINL